MSPARSTFPRFFARVSSVDGALSTAGGAPQTTLLARLLARGATHITIITPHPSGVVYPGLFRPLELPRVPPHVELRVIHPLRALRLKSFDFDRERLEEALTMPHGEMITPAR